MTIERSGGTSLIDVLDRVLDKGIVIDAWIRISLVGIDLISIEARVVVASIDTYLKYADAIGLAPGASRLAMPAPREATQRAMPAPRGEAVLPAPRKRTSMPAGTRARRPTPTPLG